MLLIKNIILSALFASVSCYELKYFNLSPTNPPITHTNMTQLFELCFANTSNPIVITENLVETFLKNLPITIKAPVVIINENFIAKNIQLYYPTYPMYILSVSSGKEMLQLLLRLIYSPSWSLKSLFFVIFETENSCERSLEIFTVLWQVGLLSSIMVCSRTGNETSLYTYNPFTNRAPNPWVKSNINYLPFTFYNQSFTNDHKICESLFFDKTQMLDGYPVKVATTDKATAFYFNFIFSLINMTQQATYFGDDVTSMYASLLNGNNDFTTVYNRYYSEHIAICTVPSHTKIFITENVVKYVSMIITWIYPRLYDILPQDYNREI
ncbi:uncharacterized protein LOC130678198 [Microplitis mediator]|uniref:uncharacterized protein LOC130678198 n=1 Tax=Microplitis mediator TaxID=375433 RepID=UPI002552B8A0|nr:uncharacterized protein LOC130678198 [Microplitis mediator]